MIGDTIGAMYRVVLFTVGLCLGSFVNALVWRLRQQELLTSKRRKTAKKTLKPSDLSITKGRSMCVHCHHTLAWYDLLPVASWLSLGGKCRYCKKVISWQYPIVELVTAGLFMLSYVYFPYELDTLVRGLLLSLWLIILTGFVALAAYDLKWMLLPNRIVFPLQALAALYVLVLIAVSQDMSLFWGAALAVLCSAGLFYMLFQISKGKWIGGGDVKLAVVLGLVLASPIQALLMLFIASCLGSLVGVPLLVWGKHGRDTKVPFGPFLIAATIIVYLFGTDVITWYSQQFLFV